MADGGGFLDIRAVVWVFGELERGAGPWPCDTPVRAGPVRVGRPEPDGPEGVGWRRDGLEVAAGGSRRVRQGTSADLIGRRRSVFFYLRI